MPSTTTSVRLGDHSGSGNCLALHQSSRICTGSSLSRHLNGPRLRGRRVRKLGEELFECNGVPLSCSTHFSCIQHIYIATGYSFHSNFLLANAKFIQIVKVYTCEINQSCNTLSLLGKGLGQATCGSVLAEEAILEINLGCSNEVVSSDAIPVHDGDIEGVVEGEDGWELKHLAKEWVELVGNVVVLVVDLVFPDLHLEVRVRLLRGRGEHTMYEHTNKEGQTIGGKEGKRASECNISM